VRSGDQDIWMMALDGAEQRPLISVAESRESTATCGPLGQQLIFTSDQDNDLELYLTDYASEQVRPLTDTEGENYHPVWSPTEDLIAFVSSREGNADIWLMDTGGGNSRALVSSTGEDIYPNWRGDGQVLVYSSNRDGDFDLYAYDLAEDTETQLTDTPTINELYPSFTPDQLSITYVAMGGEDDPNTGAVFILRETGETELLVSLEGGGIAESPTWLNESEMILASTFDGFTDILRVDFEAGTSTNLTTGGASNRWPRLCYVELERLPEPSTPTPTTLPSPTPEPEPVSLFEPVQEPQTDWIFSSETWIGDELVFIAPDEIPVDDVRGFLVDNLFNIVWDDSEGQHVVSMALEAFRGALEVTLIGYTVNDLPGPTEEVADFDQLVREKVLLHSVRPGPYHLESVEISNVNITFNFRVPAQAPEPPPGQYTPQADDIPDNWLISTERWTAEEVAALGRAAGIEGLVSVAYQGGQLVFTWTNSEGTNILVVRIVADGGELLVVPDSYTINGQDGDPEATIEVLYLIREMLLLNSIPPGEFSLSRAEMSAETLELVFLIPPQ
jgi:hypothetical protein